MPQQYMGKPARASTLVSAMKVLMMTGGLIMGMAAMVSSKDGPTYYTPERVETARENLARYDWAKAAFERIKTGDGFSYYIGPDYGPAET
ncbi:MAG: hypothetical protein HOC05_21560, partial [Gemmatimonadetes bacterium]|nr:hypothetical protein [Gemmatimonadota bacterium]